MMIKRNKKRAAKKSFETRGTGRPLEAESKSSFIGFAPRLSDAARLLSL